MFVIKSDSEIEHVRQAGKVAVRSLGEIQKVIKPGVTTRYVDNLIINSSYSR